jgi:hypothetical protein
VITYRNEPTDYKPDEMTVLFAYQNGELVHRRLIRKDEEAELRADIERRYA